MTIEEFIMQRLDEDEQMAQAAAAEQAEPADPTVYDAIGDDLYRHLARHDPARVLRQCAALREVVRSTRERNDQIEGHSTTDEMATDDLAPVAAIWSDHPDYRQGWAT